MRAFGALGYLVVLDPFRLRLLLGAGLLDLQVRDATGQRSSEPACAFGLSQSLRRYSTNACSSCVLKSACTTGKERRIARAEDEHILEAVQRRLDADPTAMRRRRKTVEHPFGTIKARMGATHFLTRTMPKVAV